jgi:hypothetical protein
VYVRAPVGRNAGSTPPPAPAGPQPSADRPAGTTGPTSCGYRVFSTWIGGTSTRTFVNGRRPLYSRRAAAYFVS